MEAIQLWPRATSRPWARLPATDPYLPAGGRTHSRAEKLASRSIDFEAFGWTRADGPVNVHLRASVFGACGWTRVDAGDLVHLRANIALNCES